MHRKQLILWRLMAYMLGFLIAFPGLALFLVGWRIPGVFLILTGFGMMRLMLWMGEPD